MAEALPISRPFFGDEERAAVQQPLVDGWVVQGPRVAEFERAVTAFSGIPHGVATTSCTTALHIAVAALGLAPGDEVIVPAFTWVSTANVVEFQGAQPVFADVGLDSFNVAAAGLEALVTERTVGLLPVHLFGRAYDVRAVAELAERRGLWVVEDAACALGTRVDGVHAGGFGDAACLSFHPRKSVTTGEGGMLLTRSEDLAARSRVLRDHGASRSDHERHHSRASFMLAEYDTIGFNYRMTDIQGALGCVQMDRAAWILAERARLAALYDEALAGLDWLRTPRAPAAEDHGWQAYVCLFAPEEPSLASADALHERRNALMTALEDDGIATRPGTHAPVFTGAYRERYALTPEQFPNAYIAERLTLALPLFAGMTESDVARVADALARHGGG